MHEPILSRVVRLLDENKGSWREISSATAVPYSTLTKIAQGTTKNPRVEAIERLDRHLRNLQRSRSKAPLTHEPAAQ